MVSVDVYLSLGSNLGDREENLDRAVDMLSDALGVSPEAVRTSKWLRLVAESEIRQLGDISVIFCSDPYILDVNLKYLSHDYYTDIITFDYCEGDKLNGDLFISIDSVRENALHFKTEFADELNRVIVHGVLHLIGYDDHTAEEKKEMRSKENYYLSLRELV